MCDHCVSSLILRFYSFYGERKEPEVCLLRMQKKLFEINPNVRIWYRWNFKKNGGGIES